MPAFNSPRVTSRGTEIGPQGTERLSLGYYVPAPIKPTGAGMQHSNSTSGEGGVIREETDHTTPTGSLPHATARYTWQTLSVVQENLFLPADNHRFGATRQNLNFYFFP